MTYKYLPTENAVLLKRVLKWIEKLHGRPVIYAVMDEDGGTYRTKNADKVLTYLDGNGEEMGVNYLDAETGDFLGWMGVMPYELDPESVIFDYSDKSLMGEALGRAGL